MQIIDAEPAERRQTLSQKGLWTTKIPVVTSNHSRLILEPKLSRLMLSPWRKWWSKPLLATPSLIRTINRTPSGSASAAGGNNIKGRIDASSHAVNLRLRSR